MNYYSEIKEKIIRSEIYDRAKDYAKDRNKVNVYFEIGKLLSEAGKAYGKNIIRQYSEQLMIEVNKKYNIKTLYKMRKFYEVFSNEKFSAVRRKLSWSHYRELMKIKNIDEIKYYITICEQQNLSYRQLCDKLKNCEYNRLNDETKDKLIYEEQLKVYDLIPKPIIIKSNTLNNVLTEYALKQSILNNLDEFLMQLGYGFTYIGNEYKIKLGDRYNYIDLLLFNYEYNCFVVVELKATELKKEHIGQIQVYMNYIDNNIKKFSHDKTIGIIICKKDNRYVVEYCSDDRVISRTYELVSN